MPVFARKKLLMEQRCLTYRPKLEFSYSGPNPDKAYPKLIDVLTKELNIPRENIQEKDFRWDRTKPEQTFSTRFEVVKDYDKFSYMVIRISMDGKVRPSEEFGKEGEVKFVLEGILRTEYPQDSFWERSFLYEMFRSFYHKVAYKDRRERYVADCRDSLFKVQRELKSFFNILTKTTA